MDLVELELKKLFFLSCIDSVQLFFYSILYPKGFHNHRRETSSEILSHKRALGSENKVQNSTFSNSSDRSLIKLLFFFFIIIFPRQLLSWLAVSEYKGFPLIDLKELGWAPNCSFRNKVFGCADFWITLSSSWDFCYSNRKQKKFSHKPHQL